MSTEIIHNTSYRNSKESTGAIFFLVGLSLLSDSVSRFVFSDEWIIALGIVTGVLSLAGLIISCGFPNTNRSRLIALFCCIIFSTVAWAVGASFMPSVQIYYKPEDMSLISAILFSSITFTCEGIRLLLILIAGGLVFSLRNFEESSLFLAKVLVGVAAVLSPLCSVGILISYALIACAVVILIGILIVFANVFLITPRSLPTK